MNFEGKRKSISIAIAVLLSTTLLFPSSVFSAPQKSVVVKTENDNGTVHITGLDKSTKDYLEKVSNINIDRGLSSTDFATLQKVIRDESDRLEYKIEAYNSLQEDLATAKEKHLQISSLAGSNMVRIAELKESISKFCVGQYKFSTLDLFLESILSNKDFSNTVSALAGIEKINDINKTNIETLTRLQADLERQMSDLSALESSINVESEELKKATITIQNNVEIFSKIYSNSSFGLTTTNIDIENNGALVSEVIDYISNAPISNTRKNIVFESLHHIGTNYIWGGTGPTNFDCSGLVQYCYKLNGVAIPRVSGQQQTAAQEISLDELKPGDLIFFGYPVHHVIMYIGNGLTIEAPHTGDVVKICKLAGRTGIHSYGSFLK